MDWLSEKPPEFARKPMLSSYMMLQINAIEASAFMELCVAVSVFHASNVPTRPDNFADETLHLGVLQENKTIYIIPKKYAKTTCKYVAQSNCLREWSEFLKQMTSSPIRRARFQAYYMCTLPYLCTDHLPKLSRAFGYNVSLDPSENEGRLVGMVFAVQKMRNQNKCALSTLRICRHLLQTNNLILS